MTSVATSDTSTFFNPVETPPPKNRELLVLQAGGTLIRAVWRDDAGYVAWYPFPKTPQWLKDKLYESYMQGITKVAQPSSPYQRSV